MSPMYFLCLTFHHWYLSPDYLAVLVIHINEGFSQLPESLMICLGEEEVKVKSKE